MIRTIIFDIGNVLADFKWREYLDSFSLPDEEREAIERVLFLNPRWQEIDRGKVPEDEILAEACAEAPRYEASIRRIYSGAAEAVSQNSYAPALLRSLKELGYRIYILSNYGKTFFEDRLSCFEFLNYVDGRVVSYEVHSVKPEPGIYEALLERYKIRPEEAVFFDDLPQNLEAARRFRLSTVLVTGYESIVEGLRSFGIEIE